MKPSAMATRTAARLQTSAVANGLRTQGVRYASGAANAPLKRTPLYDFHTKNKGKMVPFAGYSMPVQYHQSPLTESHLWTRENASVFDVSHMVQHTFKGPAAAAFLEKVTPGSWKDAELMQGKLTALLWPETGGIVDDCVVTRVGEDEFYVVTNGACLDKDIAYIDEQLGKFGGDVKWNTLDNSGLVALQGPKSAEILNQVLATDVNLDEVYFGQAFWADLKLGDGSKTHPVLISRAGYTGEDGFELSFQGDKYPALETTTPAVESILTAGKGSAQLAGLGARDSLRLEAGMCLYGHDLDDTTTPAEAGLSWIIPPNRRAEGGFHGAEVIIPSLTPRSKGGAGVTRRRIGLTISAAPAREGVELHMLGGKVGTVTSGMPSPTLGTNIAMAYVDDGCHKSGLDLDVMIRGKKRRGIVTKMPFVPTKLVRKPTTK
jgi:aminomethyltransferase